MKNVAGISCFSCNLTIRRTAVRQTSDSVS